MQLKENYLSQGKLSRVKGCMAFFTNEKFDFGHFKKFFPLSDNQIIKKILKNKKIKKNHYSFDLNSTQKIIMISLKKESSSNEIEKSGGIFFDYLIKEDISEVHIVSETISINQKIEKIYEFIHGMKLKSYSFDKYKSKKDIKLLKMNIFMVKKINKEIKKRFNALEQGVNYTKDLVSEPGNILHPDEYAKRLLKLKKIGLKVTVYDEKKLKKIGCNALVGVGQGSVRGSYLVTLEWNGKKSSSKPLAFVGKGVCFDTGGISLKPARFMEDMTYDMA